MEFNTLAAIIAGLTGTAVMTVMMLTGKRLHLPAVDAHGILGYVRDADHAGSLGYIAHFTMGAVFALGYALVFTLYPGNLLITGALLGIVHWLAVGWMFAFAPLAHAGMQAGLVEPSGPYMLSSLGAAGFIAGLTGHIVFGVVVALVYGGLAGII